MPFAEHFTTVVEECNLAVIFLGLCVKYGFKLSVNEKKKKKLKKPVSKSVCETDSKNDSNGTNLHLEIFLSL